MTRYLNVLRWRIARLIAPDPILAAPLGEGTAYLLLMPEQGDGTELYAWVGVKTLNLKIKQDVQPLGDEFGLANWQPPSGTFSGTV